MEIKVSVTITLPGRVLYKESECFNEEKVINSSKCDLFKVNVFDGKKRETLNVMHRGCIPASQSLSISRESYNYMVNNAAYGIKPRDWNMMNKKHRLEAHLKQICENIGGELKDYEVFED